MKVITVGDVDRPEFADVLHSVRAYPDSRAFVDLRSLETWVQTTAPLPGIDVILILQSHTLEHSPSILERIRQRYPITPVVTVLGPWCEGELRTGWPLAAVHRIYWNDWTTQGEHELRSLAEGKFSVFGLLPTYKDEEILLEQTKRKAATDISADRHCWIFTCRSISRPDFEMSRMLQMRMQSFGFSTSVVDWDDWERERLAGPEKILWAPGLVDEHSLGKIVAVLKELREKLPQTKILLYTNAPRIDEIRVFHKNGADSVLSQIPSDASFFVSS
ncbi:MAG: hypothetical protein FWC43_04985 [Planctomycetaceae bacterium]|nr:hypothetical protein [Planctomycetaceae bacterium]